MGEDGNIYTALNLNKVEARPIHRPRARSGQGRRPSLADDRLSRFPFEIFVPVHRTQNTFVCFADRVLRKRGSCIGIPVIQYDNAGRSYWGLLSLNFSRPG